jgi:hypothetical protein
MFTCGADSNFLKTLLWSCSTGRRVLHSGRGEPLSTATPGVWSRIRWMTAVNWRRVQFIVNSQINRGTSCHHIVLHENII